jgi:hypothetical protein
MKLKVAVFALLAAVCLTACDTVQNTSPTIIGAGVGGVAGGITGAAVTGGTGTLTGAAVGTGVGAAAGGVAGYMLGKKEDTVTAASCPVLQPIPPPKKQTSMKTYRAY